uniref:Uncharacterized protein n=1 Tax=Siphoviridae sp. ctVJE9 TaxID=2825530 RepID=A0A8S5TUP5_9CAUD|nr:MAG TPA: hypothetical protein [Siphoviridae sp. ctVJE9]
MCMAIKLHEWTDGVTCNHAWAIVKRGSFPSAILYIIMPIVSIRFYGHCHKKVIIK